MTDILKQMRAGGGCLEPCRVMDGPSGCECAQAADEIERLRAGLQAIAKRAPQTNARNDYESGWNTATEICCDIASETLSPQPDGDAS